MYLEAIANRLNKKLYRRKHRRLVQRWYADGGDARFRYDYQLNGDSFVMDLGGYEGEWAGNIYARYGCRIAIFEPVAAFEKSIRERFQSIDDIEVFQYGLGGSSRAERIYLYGAGTSTFRKRGEGEEIRIIDVEQWLDERAVDSVQLMKINIEGGEFELLERLLESRTISRIENIQVQFHNVAVGSARRMARIQEGMKMTHEPTYQYKFVWENWALKRGANEK